MLVRVLGPIGARPSPEDEWVDPPPQQRAVLALLVARLRSPCRRDRLVQLVWGDQPPDTAPRLLQGLISRLRGVLGPADRPGSRLVTVPDGWRLEVTDEQVDAAAFERLVRHADELGDSGDREAAREVLEDALELWRGRPFAELADHPMLAGDTARLDETQAAARERLLELRLADGEHDAVAAELADLTAAHPLRERLHRLLMLALYRAGRQADALAVYQDIRARLAEELGTDPGPEIQALHTAILRQEVPVGPGRLGARQSRRVRLSWQCRRDLPLAGRDVELGRLLELLEHASEAHRQVALISGEPGIGKTRLAAELADTAQRKGVEVLAGRCTDGAAVPYQPFLEALRADVEDRPDEGLPDRLGPLAGELGRVLPELGPRLGRSPAAPSVSPELDRYRLFDAVVGWLQAASRERPLVFVVEDLHVGTRPTILLFHHLVRSTSASRLLLVATYRDTADDLSEELADTVANLSRPSDVTELRLGGLDEGSVEEMIAAHSPDLADRERWADALQDATSGNPLFVEEVLDEVVGDDDLDPEELRRSAPATADLRRLLDARVRRMSPTTVSFLRQAAVAGETFRFSEVTEAAGLEEEEALDGLAEAAGARLVHSADTADERYRFDHAVMRAALLDSLTPSRRFQLHARMVETLRSDRRELGFDTASRLGHHCIAAGPAVDSAEALIHLLAAGDAAMEMLAFDDAVAYNRGALELVDPADREQRCELLLRLGQAQARAGQPERRATLLEAGRLAIELEDPDRIVRAAVAGTRGFFSRIGRVDEQRVALLEAGLGVVSGDHPGPRALLTALLASERVLITDLSERRRLTSEALQLARQQDDPLVLGRVLSLRAVTVQHPATLDERLTETAELVRLADELEDPVVRSFAHAWRFQALLEAANRPCADQTLDEALRVADDFGHPMVKAFVGSVDASRELLWGDLERAERIMQRYHTLGREADVDDADSPYLAQQFVLHRERGRLHDYLPLLERAMESFGAAPAWQAVAGVVHSEIGDEERTTEILDRFDADAFATVPDDSLWSDTMCLFAQAAADSDRHDTASTLYHLLLPYQGQVAAESSVALGSVDHYLGLLAITLDDGGAADRHLRRASEIHRDIGSTRMLNRTALVRARLRMRHGGSAGTAEASRLLRDVVDEAPRHGQHGVTNEAELLLAEVEDRTLPPGHH